MKYLCRTGRGRDIGAPGYLFMKDSKCGTWGVYIKEEDAFRNDDDDSWKQQKPRQEKLPLTFSSAFASDGAAVPTPPDPDAKLKHWLEHDGRNIQPLRIASPQAKSFALDLGFSDPSVFEHLDTQWLETDSRNRGDVLCFPERDGSGNVVGYSLRYHKDVSEKCKYAVGRRGLIVPRALTSTSFIHDGPLYIVEGASDALALLAMHRNVIGRPSATGGADYLLDFIRRLPRERWDIVVVGENDKHQGKDIWPGRDGAYRIAHRLADELNIFINVIFPPGSAKDVRDWLLAEMKLASCKPEVLNHAAFAAVGWDSHVFFGPNRVRPGEAPRYQTHTVSFYTENAVLYTAAVLGAPLCKPAVDLSDFTPERIQALADKIKQFRAEEEAAAAASIKDSMRDFDKYPCTRTRHVALQHRATGDPWLIECRCKKRGCLGCRQWLDDRELTNATLRFRLAEKEGKQLFRFECRNEQDWKLLSSQLRRAEGEYLRIATGDGGFIVFTTCVLSVCSSVNIADALAEVKIVLALHSADGKRPVSASHEWQLPKVEEKSGNFTQIGKADSRAVEHLIAIADSVDADIVPIAPKRRDGSLRRMWQFTRRSGWDADSREHIYACLSWGEVLPFRRQQKDDDVAENRVQESESFFLTPDL